MSAAYYNENHPQAAAWLRELIQHGHIADGEVDERDIRDVLPADLAGFTQCHFFAGIGGWSYALRLAGWPDERPVWTGSCPCQPFSAAGRGGGFADERHLWPSWLHLISQCRPVLGEQVASAPGCAWLDLVCSDLESDNYALGVANLCAASVGAPHIRQRLYFAARHLGFSSSGRCARLGDQPAHREPVQAGPPPGQLGDPRSPGGRGHPGTVPGEESPPRWGLRNLTHEPESASEASWRTPNWLPHRDGKSRPVEPGTFPLAHGVPGRVGLLRGYGNAIVPQLAAAFIQAYLTSE